MSLRGRRLTIVGNPLDDPIVAQDTVGAWSCSNKLKRGYAGPCMRVRRPSDDAEQDIGFQSGKVDLYALQQFLDDDLDGRVVTLYAQDGRSQDLVQADPAIQPRLQWDAGEVRQYSSPQVLGGEVFSASSESAIASTRGSAQFAFDGQYGNLNHYGWWHSANARYNSAGTYTRSVTTTVDGISKSGEWLQIQFPQQIIPSRFSISPRENLSSRMPYDGTLVGSNDGVTWSTITSWTEISTYTYGVDTFFDVSATSAYSFFRLIFQATVPNENNDSIQITQFKIFGTLARDISGFSLLGGSLDAVMGLSNTYDAYYTVPYNAMVPSGQSGTTTIPTDGITSIYAIRSDASSTTVGSTQLALQTRFSPDTYSDTAIPTPSPGASNYTVTATETLNVYAEITLSVTAGSTTVSVDDSTGFAVGDHIWIYQVQNGASNTVGYHETATISAVASGSLTMTQSLQNSYVSGTPNAAPSYTAQIVRIAEYDTLTVDGTVEATPWNGRKGGVVYLRCNAVEGSGTISAQYAGFRGAHYGTGNNSPGYEGEGIYGCGSATTVDGRVTGRANTTTSYGSQDPSGGNNTGGAPGEGTSHEGSGGGGGGHMCRGTLGRCVQAHYNMGGFAAPVSATQLFFGGGGGGGGDDDQFESSSWGGHGGGIVILECPDVSVLCICDGEDNASIYKNTPAQAKGSGGAGGTIVLSSFATHLSVRGGSGFFVGAAGGGDGSIGRVILKQYRPSAQIRVPIRMPVQAMSYKDLVSLISVSRRDLVVNAGKTSITDQVDGVGWAFGGSTTYTMEDNIPCLDITTSSNVIRYNTAVLGDAYTAFFYFKHDSSTANKSLLRVGIDHTAFIKSGSQLGVWSNRDGGWRTTGYVVPQNVWMTLVVVGIGTGESSFGTSTFYVDDQLVGTCDRVASGSGQPDTSMRIGSDTQSPPGHLAVAGLFNRALSRREITKVHNLMSNWGQGQYAQQIPKSVGQASTLNRRGLVGWYSVDSWTGTQWTDKSGRGNHVTEVGGTITVATVDGVVALTGTNAAASSLVWPTTILPSTYTFFHVSKYLGTRNLRIMNGYDRNWLSGFHNNKAGVAYHTGWITQNSTTNITPKTRWVLSTDQRIMYRANGVDFTTAGSASNLHARLCVNAPAPANNNAETSDWAIAEVLVYDRELSVEEYTTVERFLAAKHKLSIA